MSATSNAIATPKPQARSRVGNGSALLAGVDGRSATFRRYRDILATLVSDAFAGDPTEAQLQLARRAAALGAWCEEQDAAAANGQPIDISAYTTASNSLRRLLQDIGLTRVARDVTPDLKSYMAMTPEQRAKVGQR